MVNSNNRSIICLGGGVGTVHVLEGLRKYTHDLTVIASMADDGGSGGRLRRLFSIPPTGDLINCLAALSDAEPVLKELLMYRFMGDRWGSDDSLSGHKLGNLILAALTKIHGNFDKALSDAERIFSCHGRILPVSNDNISIWAKTVEGQIVRGEETIDLGKYDGKRKLSEIHLNPENARATSDVITAIQHADMIIAGPGDLYTTTLPVLLINDVMRELSASKAKKIFIINIANKPFETPDYRVSDYIHAIKKHVHTFPFSVVLANTNTVGKIPDHLAYSFVPIDEENIDDTILLIREDLISSDYTLYHDPDKLASAIIKQL